MPHKVYSRQGWGWEVRGSVCLQSHPFESAIDAQTFADHLNSGDTQADALKRMKQIVEFRGGRFYCV